MVQPQGKRPNGDLSGVSTRSRFDVCTQHCGGNEDGSTAISQVVEIWNRGKARSRGGTLKIKITRPTGTNTVSALVRRYSRVRTNPSDNYIDSLQILKTLTYPNVQKKKKRYYTSSIFSRYKLDCWRCVDLPILQSDRGWSAEINKIPVVSFL